MLSGETFFSEKSLGSEGKHLEEQPRKETPEESEEFIKKIVEIIRTRKQEEVEKQRAEEIKEGEEALEEEPIPFPGNLRRIIERLPEKSRARIETLWRELAKEAMKSAEDIGERYLVEQIMKNLDWADNRFGGTLPSKDLTEFVVVQELDRLFSNSPETEDFKKVACLMLDLNILKQINDIPKDHAKGDIYLGRVFKIFSDSELTEDIKKETGIKEIIPAAVGGDEFTIVLTADFDLSAPVEKLGDNSTVDYVIKRYQEAVESLDISDLVNFENPLIKERIREIYGEGVETPEGFKMFSTIAGGGATLWEGITNLTEKEIEGKSYLSSLELVKGGAYREADSRMYVNKANMKKKWIGSEDPKERFYGLISSRTEEEVRLKREVNKESRRAEIARTALETSTKNLTEALHDVTEESPLKATIEQELKRMRAALESLTEAA